METVDKMSESPKITEGKWCDHVQAYGQWVRNTSKPTICVISPRVFIVIEEGVVKILCPACMVKASQVPMFDA